MNVTTVMAELGTALRTISGLRVFAFPADSAQPPFALVDFPQSVEYDSTYQRGADEATFPVLVGVGRGNDRNAQAALSAYMDGSGSKSIKAAIEATPEDVGMSARVVRATPAELVVGGQSFFGALFEVHVIA